MRYINLYPKTYELYLTPLETILRNTHIRDNVPLKRAQYRFVRQIHIMNQTAAVIPPTAMDSFIAKEPILKIITSTPWLIRYIPYQHIMPILLAARMKGVI